MSGLITGHFIEGLLQFNADFAIFLLPVGELGDKHVQLLLHLGALTFSGSGLNLGELQVQDQISVQAERDAMMCKVGKHK